MVHWQTTKTWGMYNKKSVLFHLIKAVTFHLESDLCMWKLRGHRVSSLHMSQRSQTGKFNAQPDVSKFCLCTHTLLWNRGAVVDWMFCHHRALRVIQPEVSVCSSVVRTISPMQTAQHLHDCVDPWSFQTHTAFDLPEKKQQDENQRQQQSLQSIKQNFYSIHRNSTCIFCFYKNLNSNMSDVNKLDKLLYII